MVVKNYNDDYRKMITDVANTRSKISSLYDFLEQHEDYLKYVYELVAFTAYVINYDIIKDGETDEDYENAMIIIEALNGADDVTSLISDKDFFVNLYDWCVEFCNLSINLRKEIMVNATDKLELLKRLFPASINDFIYYCSDYNPGEILDDYHAKLEYYDDEKIALDDCVEYYTEVLCSLKNKDYYKFKYLVLEMFEVYYKYNKYLLASKTETDFFAKNLIDLSEVNLSLTIFGIQKNPQMLKAIVRNYIIYNNLDEKVKMLVDDYYQEKENGVSLTKVYKQSRRLKQLDES